MAQQSKKVSVLNFFLYFNKLLGWHLYLYVFLTILIGLLDGLGLTMFVPLLSAATGMDVGNESLGNLEFLIQILEKNNIPLTLIFVLLLMIGIFIVKSIIGFCNNLYYLKLRLTVIRRIRLKLIHGIKQVSYNKFTSLDVGNIQHTLVTDAAIFLQAMHHFFTSIQNLIMLGTYLFLAFVANWQFAILVSVGGLISSVLYKYINLKIKKEARILPEIGAKFNGFLIETITNFKYLKATNYISKFSINLKNAIYDNERAEYKVGLWGALSANTREPIIIIIISIVILVFVEFLNGNFATLLVSLLLFYRALTYLSNFQFSWSQFMSRSYSLDTVEDMLLEFQKEQESTQSGQEIKTIGDIVLNQVSIQFNQKKVLDSISIKIQDKSTIALIGESGAGKTTLANVISGLIPPNHGEIYYQENQLLKNSQLNTYRSRIGYISQEPVIFNDTVFNNISFWDNKTPENIKKVKEALKLVSLNQFFEESENGIETNLGHSGVLISGGQKQRISIARELYKSSQLLIMDEATSALDSETENIIKQNIENLYGKYTMVIIAHRLSTIKHADVICLMDKGKIVQQGTYQELIQKSEKFKSMVQLQEL